MRQNLFLKIWDFFRYDLPNFFRNLWLFRKNLWNHRWYGGESSILPWVKTAVDDMSWKLEKYGNEVEIPRMKKVEKMKRLSYLIDICVNDKFIDIAESELGEFTFNPFLFESILSEDGWVELKDNETPEEKERNDKIIQRCKEIEKEYWNELISILKGPDYEEFDNSTKEWDEWYDGTDLRNWWD